MLRSLFLSLVLGCAFSSSVLALTGAELFQTKTCAACHGPQAQGNDLTGAPSLAGQDPAYIQRQLSNFRAGIRGYDKSGAHSMAMRPIAMTLTDQDISALASYLNKLPVAKFPRTLTASVAKGKELFATCAACHGERAEGNPVVNAPSLAILQDWYIFFQLDLFKNGGRGNHPKDQIGMVMPPLMQALQPQDLKDLSAYIYSLRSKSI